MVPGVPKDDCHTTADSIGYYTLLSWTDFVNVQELIFLSHTCRYLRSVVHPIAFKYVSCWSLRRGESRSGFKTAFHRLAPEPSDHWRAIFGNSILNTPALPRFGLQVLDSRIPPTALKYVRRLFLANKTCHGLHHFWFSKLLRLLPSLEEISLSLVYQKIEPGEKELNNIKKDVRNLIECILDHKPTLPVHLYFQFESSFYHVVTEYMTFFQKEWALWTDLNVEKLNLTIDCIHCRIPVSFLASIQKLSNLKEFFISQSYYNCYAYTATGLDVEVTVVSDIPKFLQGLPKLTKLRLETTEQRPAIISDWTPSPCLQELQIPCIMFKSNHTVGMFDQITKLELKYNTYSATKRPPLRNLDTLVLDSFYSNCAEMLTHFVSLNRNLVNLALVECKNFSPSTDLLCECLAKIKRFECYFSDTLQFPDVIANAPKLCSLTYQSSLYSGMRDVTFPMLWLVSALVEGKVSPDLERIYIDLPDYRNAHDSSLTSWVRSALKNRFRKRQVNQIVGGVLTDPVYNIMDHECTVVDVKLFLHYWASRKKAKTTKRKKKQNRVTRKSSKK